MTSKNIDAVVVLLLIVHIFTLSLIYCTAGISVRNCQTDASIFFMIMELMRKWLLPPDVTGSQQGLLTSKELLVLLQRLAQVDRVQGIPTNLRKTWETGFLDLLYDVITTRKVC